MWRNSLSVITAALLSGLSTSCATRSAPHVCEPDLSAVVGKLRQSAQSSKPGGFDRRIEAEYERIRVVHGPDPGPDFQFEAYDHQGTFGFTQHDYALLFLGRSARSPGMFLHKYQFVSVFPTAGGTFASCGPGRAEYLREHHGFILKIEPVSFEPPVRFSVEGLTPHEIETRFPSEYFRHEPGVAVCTHGSSLDELLQSRQRGVLKARGVCREK